MRELFLVLEEDGKEVTRKQVPMYEGIVQGYTFPIKENKWCKDRMQCDQLLLVNVTISSEQFECQA